MADIEIKEAVGKRVLLREKTSWVGTREAEIKEISPSGKYFKADTGVTVSWYESSDWIILEVLDDEIMGGYLDWKNQ